MSAQLSADHSGTDSAAPSLGNEQSAAAEEGDNRTFIVSRKGDRWRVDVCGDFKTVNPPKPADGQAVSDWFAERLRLSPQLPLYVCDGKTVSKHKRSAQPATPTPLVGHEWYYVDPARGHAVVLAELFNLPADTPSDPEASKLRQTIRRYDEATQSQCTSYRSAGKMRATEQEIAK